EAKREDANRVAYARTPEEQAAVLARGRDFLTTHVVIQGVLLASTKEFADARWYQPEGIYLVDDQGRKFKPVAVDEGNLRSERLIYMPPVSQYTTTADTPRWVTGSPRVVFPAEALTPATRALTLYFAAASRRFSFTWQFAPNAPGSGPTKP